MRWTNLLRVAAALAAVAVFALPAWSQGSAEDFYVDEDADQGTTILQSLRDFSAVGVAAGTMKIFGGDLGSEAEAKGIGQGVFRYRFNDRWIATGEFGFGWNDFKDKGDTVMTVTFGTVGLARRVATPFSTDLRLGIGAGVYRWNYKYNGKSLRDSESHQFYRGIDFGGYIGLEDEYRLTQHVTFLTLLQHHFVMTADSEKFRSLFDENHSFLSLRVGVAYHFSPYEGILWEGKGQTRIRLESGKEGK